MTLIERIKGLFKPKLTLEQFAIAITSDVRLAIIEELGSLYELALGREFGKIRNGVNVRLDRQVSRESLTWHLEKLKDNKIIKEIPCFDYTVWNLTSNGREVFNLLEKVEREMEEAEGR